MRILDINPTHQLALVVDDVGHTSYQHLANDWEITEELDYTLLKQYHTVARSSPQGLYVHKEPMVPGWAVYDAKHRIHG